jgi:DnaJ-class molecular chaperone
MTNLILTALIGLPLYAVFCLARPTKSCRRCGGWGSKAGRSRRAARRHCRRCDGTGQRFRVPARAIQLIRGAQRRHAVLTARAAERAAQAETEPGCSGQEREQVRS